MHRHIRIWSRKEVAFLQWNAERLTLHEIAQELGRTDASVERKLRDLKLRCSSKKPRSEWMSREPGEMTPELLAKANALHLADLKKAGHTWWHRISAAEADTLPMRVPVPDSTFSQSSCYGSPAAMCAE